jgi:DmsE family decaheme c-type cytochrome
VLAQNPAQPVAGGATLVGDDKCIACHADQGEVLSKTPHGQKADLRTPSAKQGCETCHGPGSKHVDDPANVKMPVAFSPAMSSADINATCESCHNRGPHALWNGSKHDTRGLACTTCHSVHNFKSETHQLKAKSESELCATCHRDKVAKLGLPAHMPVREGKMTCTSCHDPHGSTNVKLLRVGDTVTQLCTSCHPEKRGPFLWEHAPVSEGCTTCHDAHGSVNERMLVAKLPMLCQRCHISTRHPATIYDSTQLSSNRLYNRGCVNCHVNIHGSNHPSGQFFLR